MIRVLIVDDHPFLRLGVAMLLAQAEGIAVVGECTDGSEVLGAATAVRPDVVLMDINMPGARVWTRPGPCSAPGRRPAF